MEPKKFRFVSLDALIADIADCFVPKTDDWERDVAWAEGVVFDDVLPYRLLGVSCR